MEDYFVGMTSTSVQLNDEQMDWVSQKANEKAKKERKRPSKAEIIRAAVQAAIDAEKA